MYLYSSKKNMKKFIFFMLIIAAFQSCSNQPTSDYKVFIEKIVKDKFDSTQIYLLVNYQGCQTCVVYADDFLTNYFFKDNSLNLDKIKVIFIGENSPKMMSLKFPKYKQYPNIYFDQKDFYKVSGLDFSYPIVFLPEINEFIIIDSQNINAYNEIYSRIK